MATTGLDIANYVTVPNVNVKRGVALGISLLTEVPPNAPEPVKSGAVRLRTSTVALQQAWAARENQQPESARDADSRHDEAWGGLRDALKSAMTLRKKPERQQAAVTVYDRLFTRGFGFLKDPFKEQWAESERLLQLIETDELAPAINLACGGPDHLEELHDAHLAYGAALKITEPRVAQAEVNLLDELVQLRQSIASYALQVVAWSGQAVENAAPAAAALLPIDEARSADARRSSGSKEPDPDVTPQTNVPPVPEA